MSATGALLLLAAAGTFLVVSWDTLPSTARIAVVATGTAAAIVGGHHLRRRLPAVGSVVFHLGALLVPIDALGAALQWGASPAGRWLAVGVTSVLVLPVLAATGRSNVLWWGAVAGVPTLATGIGMSTGVPAPVLVAGVAVLLAVLARPLATAPLVPAAGWTLATVAVHLPVAVAAVRSVPASGGAVDHLAAAGWQPTSWPAVLAATVVAVAALGLLAHARRSAPLRSVAALSAVVGGLTALVPSAPPGAVLVVLPAGVFVVVEVVAWTAEPDPRWRRATSVLGLVAESLAAAAAVPLLVLGLLHAHAVQVAADGVAGVAIALVAAAWTVAAVRRTAARGWRTSAVPLAAGAAVLHGALALTVLGVAASVAVVLSLGGAATTLAWRPEGPGRSTSASTGVPAWLAALAVLLGLVGAALLLAIGSVAVVAVVLVTAAVLGQHVWRSRTAVGPNVEAAVGVAVSLGVVTILAGSVAVGRLPGAIADWAAVVAAVALLGLATSSEPRPWAAQVVRTVAMLVGSFAAAPVSGPYQLVGLHGSARTIADVLALGPGALLPAAIVGGWLLADAVRCRRPVVAALAAPALVRLVASLALVVAPAPTAGIVVLACGVVAASIAVVGVGRWTPPLVVLALSAAAVGVPLVGTSPELRAGLLVVAGLVVAAGGAARRNGAVAHLGGIVAVIGTWQLLALQDVRALDLWVAPLALQLWIAGLVSRRRDRTSSWVADVPPLLLVAVPALIERAAGGGGWHAVLAGGLAVVAVVGGGGRRLGGPLVVGTVVLVAIVGVEVFAVVAVVPTWIWLGMGGLTLVGAGAAMELADGSPATATRRLVHVVRERFD